RRRCATRALSELSGETQSSPVLLPCVPVTGTGVNGGSFAHATRRAAAIPTPAAVAAASTSRRRSTPDFRFLPPGAVGAAGTRALAVAVAGSVAGSDDVVVCGSLLIYMECTQAGRRC